MRVAVAVITDKEQRILITQRGPQVSHPGLWEFPGGKLEPGESATDALIREIKEEVGLEVLQSHFIGEIHHTYEHHAVSLLVYHVSDFSGMALICEGQMDLRWVPFNELRTFKFPAANEEILDMIGRQGRDFSRRLFVESPVS